MATRDSIKITNCTLDVFTLPANPKTGTNAREMLIIRGIIDPDSLDKIKVDDYQREVLPGQKSRELKQAVRMSMVPDIELGMRGDKQRMVEGGACYLQDDVYIIDGLQRVSAALEVMREDSSFQAHIGAVIFLDTDRAWETERFRILNQDRTKLSANVLIRNLRDTNEGVAMLYALATEASDFVLKDRIAWSQRMKRGELVPALVFVASVNFLHSRFGPGKAGRADEAAQQLGVLVEKVGKGVMRDNVKTFFGLIHECFNLNSIAIVESASCIRRNFLVTLCEIFTRHKEFWRGDRLFIDVELRRKIAKFPIRDHYIEQLCSTGGAARDILYELMLRHINSKKQTRHLTPFEGMEPKELSCTEAETGMDETGAELVETGGGGQGIGK